MVQKLHKGKNFFFGLVFFLVGQSIQAQLADFTLSVTATSESCTGNGTLSFVTANATVGSTMVFRIYKLPNTTTPIATQSTTTLGGLVAGNYRVIAIQSLGNDTNSQQQDQIISSSIVDLFYQIQGQNAICGNDAKITVNITQGTAVSYEIFSGPAIRPLQPSNVFDLLPAGSYQIRVFDDCGEGVVQNYTVTTSPTYAGLDSHGFSLPNCNTLTVTNRLGNNNPQNQIAYPLTIQFTLYPPTGPAVQYQQTITAGSPNFIDVLQDFPLYYNQLYHYKTIVTDRCGNVYDSGLLEINVLMKVYAELVALSCNNVGIKLIPENVTGSYTVSFLQAPAGFNPLLFNSDHPGPFPANSATYYLNNSIQTPSGHYKVRITDVCGRFADVEFDVAAFDDALTFVADLSCNVGYGVVTLYYQLLSNFTSAVVTAAPAGYPYPLPHHMVIPSDNSVFLSFEGPEGNYSVSATNECDGDVDQLNFNIFGYHVFTNVVHVIEKCNSFDLDLHYDSNGAETFWLQRFDPLTNNWSHPVTGATATGGDPIDSNSAISLNNDTVNLNLGFYTGSFRVVRKLVNGINSTCEADIYTFEYSGQPEITDAYSFACSANVSDVVVVAHGVAPLTYKITTKNGAPFTVNNGTSPIFLGLEPAVYNFQVQDFCGNILNRLFDITIPVNLSITPSNFCSGTTGALSLPNFSFLNYHWWKGDNATTILSTSNSLQFPAFNPAADSGIYHVNVSYPNSNSCIDFTLDYEIFPDGNVPDAGTGTTAVFCDRPASIDLFTLLPGAFTPGGSWQNTDNAGTLSANNWSPGAALPGTYHFTYTVTGLCSSDATTAAIQFNKVPQIPNAITDSPVCTGEAIHLQVAASANTTYHWSGPNGFTSDEASPTIPNASVLMNGDYSVTATLGSCVSEPVAVNVAVNPLPEFILADSCENNNFLVRVVPSNQSFDESMVSYVWSGPENYTSSQNPAVITKLPKGIYSVTVTAANGCSATASIDIPNTFCSVPAGISPNNDGNNDLLDLSGLDILKFEVFSRYGRLVFEQDNYTDQWHGQDFNGRDLPDATYYYYMRLSSGEEKTGWIYVTKYK